MSAELVPTPANTAATIHGRIATCRFCKHTIQWGTTNRGRPAPFDLQPPHFNHWITCPERAKAAKVLKRARRRTPP